MDKMTDNVSARWASSIDAPTLHGTVISMLLCPLLLCSVSVQEQEQVLSRLGSGVEGYLCSCGRQVAPKSVRVT
jgi:hypothetical protein